LRLIGRGERFEAGKDNPMTVREEASGGASDEKVAPDYLAHFVVKTPRSQQMIAWYKQVFGARVIHEDSRLAFLTWDDESHRLAFAKLPSFLRFVFPLARFRRKLIGVDHIGFTVGSLEKLLTNYERLKKVGITPVWCINHGLTTSMYYEDPDGIRLEFQVENFPTAAETAAYFERTAFADNPIGVNFDPDYLLERFRRGDDLSELTRQGAGTRPGTKARANKRALTWKTL
jgi:catechol 2,3-dioxygenase-like lactoylglutathione lyase family enzyme